MIILFFILCCIIFVCLLDKDFQKYKRSMDKKFNRLLKKYKYLERQINKSPDTIGVILDKLEDL